MRSSKRKAFILATATSFAGIYGLTVGQASGANATWNSVAANSFWNNSGNWSSAGAAYLPLNSDNLFFGNSNITNLNDDFASFTSGSIVFNAGTYSYTMNGASALTLGAGAGIVNNATGQQTFNMPLTLALGYHQFLIPTAASAAAAGTTINLNGTFTRDPQSTVLFTRLVGNGSTTFTGGTVKFGSGVGPANDATGILGGWATFKNVSGTANVSGANDYPSDWATRDANGNIVAYTAYAATINGGGNIPNTPGANIKLNGTGNIGLAATVTDVNSLNLATANGNRTVTVGSLSTLRLGAQGGILDGATSSGTVRTLTIGVSGQAGGTGTLTAGGAANTPGTLYLYDSPISANTGNNLTINSVITDNGTGAVSVNVSGYVAINSANSYTGGTYINQGRVQAGTGAFGTGSIVIQNGGQILFNQNTTYTNDLYIRGFGTTESGGIGAMRINGTGRTLSGLITLMGDTATGNGTVTGRIVDSTPSKLFIGSGSANGSGTLQVGSAAGPNDYHGDTIINNDGSVGGVAPSGTNTLSFNLGRNNVMPHGAGYGNVILNGISGTVQAKFDLNGTSQTINGLSSTATSPNDNIVTNRNSNTGTLTIGDNNSSSTFGGQIQSATAITKIGNGKLTLSNDNNNYNGQTTVSAGTLALIATNQNNISNSAVISVAGGATLDTTGVSSGFNPGGQQRLINNGTVLGAINANGGTLGGDAGSYATITLNGGHTNPGASGGGIGSFSATGVTMNSGSLVFDVDGANADKLTLTQPLVFNGGGVTMKLINEATAGSYTLATAPSITGTPTMNSGGAAGRTLFTVDTPALASGIFRVTVGAVPGSGGGGAANLRWDNSAPATGDGVTWDTKPIGGSSQQNFFNPNPAINGPDNFYELDNVTFNDQNNGHYTVNIAGAGVGPSSVVIAANSGDYVLQGGGIFGPADLTISGTRTVTLDFDGTYTEGLVLNSGTLDLRNDHALGTGTVTIAGGNFENSVGDKTFTNNNPMVLAGNFTAAITNNLNTGTGAVTLTADPTINVVNANKTLTIGGAISDGAAIHGFTKTGTGTLILGGTSTFKGAVNISAGVVRAGNFNALGDPLTADNGTVTIASGAQLDLGDMTASNIANGFGAKVFHIAGAGPDGTGAIVNTGRRQQNAFESIILDANATIGGNTNGNGDTTTPGRIDIRGGVAGLDLQGFTLTKTGDTQFTLVSTSVSTTGNIVVNQGTLGFETNSNVQGPGSITFAGGTHLQVFNTAANAASGIIITRPIFTTGDIDAGQATSGTATVASPITLGGNLIVNNFNNSTGTLVLSGNITETGGSRTITKRSDQNSSANPNTVLVLSGTNTFTGGLNIESGQVQLGSTSALNATTPQRVNFNGATVLRLAGNSVSVSGINGGSGTPAAIIENNNATAATLTIASITDLSFDGTLQNGAAGTLALTKTGSSRQTLSGSSSYTGATTINGGTLEIGNGGSTGQLSGLSPISGTSAGTLALNRSADVTIANPISGAVNVVKNGGNVVTYSGTYSSTGTVTVSQGALSVTGSMTATAPTQVNGGVTLGGSGSVGSVNMDGGALLRPGASPSDGSVATLTMGSLKSNGIDIRFDLAPTPAGANDRVAVTNVASFASGTTTITPLFAFNALPSSPGTYTLLTAGTLSVDPGASLSLTAPPTGSRLAYHLNTTTGAGGSVQLVVDSAFGNITWTGANSNVWDVNGATNWQQASNPNDKFFNFDSVTLDDSSAVRSISLGTQVIASTITVNNANYTVSGAGGFTGSNGLNKLGNGQLIIATTNNNYTGTTAIQNGTLSLGASNILPNPANIVLGSGANSGVLDLGGFDATVTSLAVSGTGTGNAVVNNGAAISTSTLTYNNNGNAGTFAAALNDGTGKLALNVASGTLTLTSNNTYSGMTTIAANNALQVGAGGTTGSIGTGDVTNNGTLLFNRTTDTTVSGAISGSGKLIKTNTNKLTLGGGSSYTDQTIITGGTVSFGASNNLGDPNASGNTIAMGGGAALLSTGANVDLGTNRNVTVGTTLGTATFLGGVIDVPGTNVLKISGNIVGANTASNSLTKNGTGKLVLSGDNTGFVNEWIVNGGVIEIGESNDILDGNGTIFFNGNGATLHVTADINLSTYPTNKLTTSAIGGAASTGTFDVDSGKTFTIGSLGGAAVIRTAQGGGLAGGGSFYKAGLGTMVFQGNNQQLDVPVIVMGGTVVATEANSVGGVGGGNSVALNPNTNLYFQNDSSTNYNNAAVASGTTRITIDGAAGTANVFVDRVNSNSGDLTHTVGSLGFNAGGNTLSISPGSHQTGGATSLTFVQGIVMNDNGTLVVQSAGAATMTVESQAPISGTGTFAKSGDGTLILSGTTTVTAGDVRPAGGTIKLASANGLSSNTLDYNNYGGVFTFGAQTAATFGGLKGAQNLALTNDAAGTVTLSVGANNADNTYSGNLTGGGSLTKIGNGTQTLSGNNAYTGGTTLSAGELGIATDSNIGGAASVINFNGGLLRVTGTTLNNLNTHTVNWSTFNGGFDIADSTNTFTVSNNIAGSGGLIKTGAGSLLLTGANSYTGTTSLKAGKLVALGDAARTPLLSGNGTTGGTDITGGQLILDYSPGGSTNPSSTVSTTLTAGYNLPSKFSSGVLRTSATADSTKGLGWRDDGGNKQVTVMYTYFGDAGVDGQVTTADFNQVAAHFNGAGNWAAGDFNYDGIVNALDFNAVATNFGKVALPSQPALGAPVLGTLVPEPGTALLGVVAGLGLMRRRRRGA